MEYVRKYYHKLVRDGIPTILDNADNVVSYSLQSPYKRGEIAVLLRQKLQEEVHEYLSNPCEEELGDILTVIKALAEMHLDKGKDSFAALNELATLKDIKNGTFEEANLLIWVEEIVND